MNKQIQDMNKDELAAYAKDVHGLDLDMRKGVDALRAQLMEYNAKNEKKPEAKKKAKADDEAVIETVDQIPLKSVTHFKNPANGAVFVATALLADSFKRYGHPVPCDKNGRSVSVIPE